jgi:hypothetical protein
MFASVWCTYTPHRLHTSPTHWTRTHKTTTVRFRQWWWQVTTVVLAIRSSSRRRPEYRAKHVGENVVNKTQNIPVHLVGYLYIFGSDQCTENETNWNIFFPSIISFWPLVVFRYSPPQLFSPLNFGFYALFCSL